MTSRGGIDDREVRFLNRVENRGERDELVETRRSDFEKRVEGRIPPGLEDGGGVQLPRFQTVEDRALVVAQGEIQDVGERVGGVGGEEEDALVRTALGEEQRGCRGAGGLADATLAADEPEEAQCSSP